MKRRPILLVVGVLLISGALLATLLVQPVQIDTGGDGADTNGDGTNNAQANCVVSFYGAGGQTAMVTPYALTSDGVVVEGAKVHLTWTVTGAEMDWDTFSIIGKVYMDQEMLTGQKIVDGDPLYTYTWINMKEYQVNLGKVARDSSGNGELILDFPFSDLAEDKAVSGVIAALWTVDLTFDADDIYGNDLPAFQFDKAAGATFGLAQGNYEVDLTFALEDGAEVGSEYEDDSQPNDDNEVPPPNDIIDPQYPPPPPDVPGDVIDPIDPATGANNVVAFSTADYSTEDAILTTTGIMLVAGALMIVVHFVTSRRR